MASRLEAIVERSAVYAAGLACAGLGIALAARGSDLPLLAALGLEAALMQVLAQAVAVALLGLCAFGSGSGRMAGAWIGAGCLSALPPFAGFSSFLLLLHALFAACRIGGGWLQIGCAFAVVAAGLSAALASVAMVRLLGFGTLARGREAPALAGAEVRIGIWVLACCGAALAIGPGPALLGVEPAVRTLVSGGVSEVSLSAPAIVAAMVGVACAGVLWFVRPGGQGRVVPAWQGGAASIAVLEPYVPQRLAVRPGPVERRAPTLREWLTAASAALAVALIVLAAR